MKNYKLLVYKTLDDKLIDSWKNLWNKSKYANFFNSYDFFLTCINTFNKNFEVFCLERNGELIIVLPLVRERVFGISSYIDPGGRFVEKSPILIKDNDKESLKLFIDFILEKGNIHLSEISLDISRSLKDLYPKSVISIISVNPYIDLNGDPLAQISKEHIKRIKRKIFNNEKKFNYYHLKKNLAKALKVVINLEKNSHKKKKGKEIFNSELSVKFYENLLNYCSKYLVIDLLKYENKPFVSLTGIICKNRYYAYHTSYLRDYKYLMPGKTIIFFVIEQLKKEGIELFDFVRGYSSFKEEFTRNFSIQYDFYSSKNNLINIWWKLINYIRRRRILLLKTKNSKDYLYLFKSL